MAVQRMFPFLLLALPLAELYLLLRVGASVGFLNVVIGLLIAASIGFRIVQAGSWTVLQQVQSSLQRGGEPPTRAVLDSAVVMAGGLLLIIPGFITDMLALLCLIPVSRRGIAAYLADHGPLRSQSRPRPGAGTDVIEGEFRRDD